MIYQRRKNPLKFFLVFFGLLVFLIYASLVYWNSLNSPVDKNGIMRAFVILKGESVDTVAERLQQEGLIRSFFYFQVSLKTSGQDSRIQAGDFKLSPAMTTTEIIDNLSKGPIDRWVTLIEGLRVEEMAGKLNKELGVSSQEFIKLAKKDEGYLFPDTYLFNPEARVEDIVSILRNNFEKKFEDTLKQKIKENGLTEEQGVILASIVEREARSDEARRMVASILLKRIKIGMKLDADATVQYALGYQTQEKSWWKRHLTNGDKQVKSLFNTYTNSGLPPAPICNPSLSSLKAVANADSSVPYFYYYHDSKGNSYYSKTLDEHNEKVAKYP